MFELVWLEGKHTAQTAHCALVPELFQKRTRNCAHLLHTFSNYYVILSTYNVIWSIVTLCLIKAYAIEICIKDFDKFSALNSKKRNIQWNGSWTDIFTPNKRRVPKTKRIFLMELSMKRGEKRSINVLFKNFF